MYLSSYQLLSRTLKLRAITCTSIYVIPVSLKIFVTCKLSLKSECFILDFHSDCLDALADILYTGKTSKRGPQLMQDLDAFLATNVQLSLEGLKQEKVDKPDASAKNKLNDSDFEDRFVEDFQQGDFHDDKTENFSNEFTTADQEQVSFDIDFEEDKPLKKVKKNTKNVGQKLLEKVLILDNGEFVNNKSFHCDFCPKYFPTKSLLITHTRRHTGEKPFPCRFCPKKFSQKGNRQSHEKKCNSKVWTPDKNHSAIFIFGECSYF